MLPITPSGDLKAAWWDAISSYLVVDLNGTLYHYCAFNADDVDGLVGATSGGDYYQAHVRGSHDCRVVGTVPVYADRTSSVAGAGSTSSGIGYDPGYDQYGDDYDSAVFEMEYDLGRPLTEDEVDDLGQYFEEYSWEQDEYERQLEDEQYEEQRRLDDEEMDNE